MLYAQINKITNQMVSKPINLPTRWTTPEGATITHFDKLPKQSLWAFDWCPVIYEELSDGAIHNSDPIFDKVNRRFIFEAISQNIDIFINESKHRIDEVASFVCDKYISKGVGQDCRYMLKREQAINFLADTNPDIVNYPMIKREAEECAVTNNEMAQFIVNTAETWTLLASEVEALRVGGKKKCKEATNVTEVIQFRNAAISALELI